jgi:hypothetical protein
LPTNLDTLRAQPLTLIQPATQALANGGSIGAWRKQMELAIKRSQTAAYIAATAERLGVSPSAIKGLSRAERKELDERIRAQLKYLDGFVADLKAGKLTMAQATARANLYAGATKQAYYVARWGDWIIPEHLLPGNQICKTNCGCSISVKAEGEDSDTGTLTRVMGKPEKHCTECPALVGSYEVKRKRIA